MDPSLLPLVGADDRLRLYLETAEVVLLLLDREGRVREINRRGCELLGCREDELVGQDWFATCVPADLRDDARRRFRSRIAGEAVARTRFASSVLGSDGEVLRIAWHDVLVRDERGEVIGCLRSGEDVTERLAAERRLQDRAAQDPLTGLPNRAELERRLTEAWEDSRLRQVQHALCYIDLDRFKLVNDLCGHPAGDELLRQLAQLLRRQVRASDLLARLGGDEFGLLLEGCALERAQQIAEQICRAVRDFRFTWEGRIFELGASVGIVAITAQAANTAALLARADAACYAAKDQGRNRVQVDREGDPDQLRRHIELSQLSALLAGLEQGRFGLVFQPIVPLAAATAGEQGVRGEVLLRWKDARGRFAAPATFIPAAERHHLMPAVDRWVVREALKFFGALQSAGRRIDAVSINLSANTLADAGFANVVRGALATSGLAPDAVWFEITETAAINNVGQVVELMETLRAAGCHFALDDFGSGLSSFRLLRSLPVEGLKIDGSFVRGMSSDRVDRAIVESTVRVARAMRIVTVAEWVEFADLLPRLRELGVDYAQGLALGMPVPLDRLRGSAGRDEESVESLRPSPLVAPARSRLGGPH